MVLRLAWGAVSGVHPRKYTCGHCGALVGPNQGFKGQDAPTKTQAIIYICTHCSEPTYFCNSKQIPGSKYGDDIAKLPDDVRKLYDEIRLCYQASAYTSAVLCSRKLLMHIAVEKEAEEGKNFVYYVEYLNEKHYIPPDGTGWVDLIRTKGNEANHEIRIADSDDAKKLIAFVAMLLRFVYEFPLD